MKCPKCGSGNVKLDTGGQTGKYHCVDCNYTGVLILEEEK